MEEEYGLWLCNLPGIGSIRGRKLLALCGGKAEKLYHAPETVWRQVVSEKIYMNVKRFTETWKLEEEYGRLAEQNIGFVSLAGKEYPEKLKNIADPPLGLYYRGGLPEGNPVTVAVIGARDCSEYGRYVAEELGKALGERGFPLVSGMARGIDGISQSAALRHGGSSFGVLGCGVDICYPSRNRDLYVQLMEKGAILSAYPPGTEPKPGNFPPRNRIVSGLSDVVVVIEARSRSGTLITVDMALEQGRDVYVVPGRVTDRLSDGCNRLLKQGAQVFLSPEDFLEDMLAAYPDRRRQPVSHEAARKEGRKTEVELSPKLAQVYGALDFEPRSVEQIQSRMAAACPVCELGPLLMTLCMKELAIQISPGYFCIPGKCI